MFKEEWTQILHNSFQKNGRGRNTFQIFYDTSSTQLPKQTKIQLSLVNIDIQILNKILVNRVQQYIKGIIHHDQMQFIPEMYTGSIFENESM